MPSAHGVFPGGARASPRAMVSWPPRAESAASAGSFCTPRSTAEEFSPGQMAVPTWGRRHEKTKVWMGGTFWCFFWGGRLGREHYQTDLSIGFCIKKIARLDLQSVNFGIQGILLVISGLRLSRMVAWNVYPSVDGSSFFFQGEHRGHYQLDVASGFGTFSWQGPQGFVA